MNMPWSISTLLLAGLLAALMGGCSHVESRPCPVDNNNSVFHGRLGQICPDGYSRVSKFFRERDGSTQDACVSQTRGDGSMDCVMPGESFDIRITIEPPPGNPAI